MINIIMQNKESDRVDKKNNSIIKSKLKSAYQYYAENKVSKSMIKNCCIIVVFMNPLIFS